MRRERMLGLGLLCACLFSCAQANALDLNHTERLQVGIGDRLSVKRDGKWVPTVEQLDALGLNVDLLQIWLPKGWSPDWVKREQLDAVTARGITPVVVHYYFGDLISKERVEAQRDDWYSSLWNMAQRIRGDAPVLVILEPEFNIAPPRGETAITSWSGFAEELRAAAELIRKEAPNALVGTCPGDFPGPPNLERVLGPVAADLDFIAFQEMRARTDRDRKREGYLNVGRSAVEYARYLQRAFGRPVLLGYLAVSSHRGWDKRQAQVLRDMKAQQPALLDAGVWGVIYFQLYDDPDHRGYFGRAEQSFGLITPNGRKKPAFEAFEELTRQR
jgi:hypothetical protein